MDRLRRARFLPGRIMTFASAPPAGQSVPPVVKGEPVLVSDGVYVIPDNHVPIVPNVGMLLALVPPW